MIEIREFTKKFGTYCALDHISLKVEPGVIVGLVGSNGAGKSTLLRSIAGVYEGDGGILTVDGESPYENPSVKEKIFFLSDYPYFQSGQTLQDLAAFYARFYRRWSKEKFDYLSRIFPVGKKQRLSEMSKGMQRQCALICAVSCCPDYLIMDEIFDGLDPVMRQLLKRIVSGEVAERNMSVVIASHNLRELEDFCDYIGMLHRGGIVLEKDLDSIKLGIHKIQAAFRPMPEIEQLKQQLDIVTWEAKGSLLNLVVRGEEREINRVFETLHPIFFETLPLSLEEVFINEMEAAGYDLENILK